MNQMILTKSPRLKPVSTFSPNPFLLLFQIQKNSLFLKTLSNTKTLLLFHLFLVQGSQHILQLWMLIKYVESCPTGDSVVIMFTLAPLFLFPFFKKKWVFNWRRFPFLLVDREQCRGVSCGYKECDYK